MSYNKSVLALGLIVGIILVAGILQLRFHFDPPEDNFTNKIDNLLNYQLQQMGAVLEDAPPLLQSNPIVEVVPTVSTDPIYQSNQVLDLTTGIALATASETAGPSLLLLRGDQLVLMEYDTAWQLRGEEHVIATDINLVDGQPPVAYLQAKPDSTGYRVFINQSTAVGVVVNVLEVDTTFQTTTTRAIATSPVLMTAAEDTLWSYTTDDKLQLFNIEQASLIAEPNFTTAPCSLLPDAHSVIAVTAATDQLSFTKINSVGVLEPTVVASVPGVTVCTSSVRKQEYLAVATAEHIQMLDDDLATAYPALSLPTPALFSHLGFVGDQLWLVYSTSATLGEYQLHVAMYDPLVVVEQPDVTDEYTN